MSSDENRELDENKLSLELYKELGLEGRQRGSERTATNRLMLPPLVIGLLVLYGEVETFLGVEFDNPEAIYRLVWFGCVVISLIWICNMSRLAQLSHWYLETQRECERNLGLIGHQKIAKKDKKRGEDLPVLNILRHSKLRFIGFGIYFSLLLYYILQSMDFIAALPWFIDWHEALILWFALSGGGGLSYGIWYLYLKDSSTSAKEASIKCLSEENSQREPKVKRKVP